MHSYLEIQYGGQQINNYILRTFLRPKQDLFKKTVSVSLGAEIFYT